MLSSSTRSATISLSTKTPSQSQISKSKALWRGVIGISPGMGGCCEMMLHRVGRPNKGGRFRTDCFICQLHEQNANINFSGCGVVDGDENGVDSGGSLRDDGRLCQMRNI